MVLSLRVDIPTKCPVGSFETSFIIVLSGSNICFPIPSVTLQQIYNQYAAYSVSILISISDRANTNCTPEDITNNIKAIRKDVYVSYIFIPESYIKNNATQVNSWNASDIDTCFLFGYNAGPGASVVIEDNVALEIESDILKWQQQSSKDSSNFNSSQPFEMMLMTDFNCDGLITWQDYELHVSASTSNTDYDQISISNSAFWVLFVFNILIVCCCSYYNKILEEKKEC